MNLSNLSKSHSKETNQTQLWLQAHIYINLLFYMMFVREQGGVVVGEAFKIRLILLVLFFYMEYNDSIWGILRK